MKYNKKPSSPPLTFFPDTHTHTQVHTSRDKEPVVVFRWVITRVILKSQTREGVCAIVASTTRSVSHFCWFKAVTKKRKRTVASATWSTNKQINPQRYQGNLKDPTPIHTHIDRQTRWENKRILLDCKQGTSTVLLKGKRWLWSFPSLKKKQNKVWKWKKNNVKNGETMAMTADSYNRKLTRVLWNQTKKRKTCRWISARSFTWASNS